MTIYSLDVPLLLMLKLADLVLSFWKEVLTLSGKNGAITTLCWWLQGGSEMGSPFVDGKAGAQRGNWLIRDGFSFF